MLHRFLCVYFTLMDLIYDPHQTLEEHDGMFQPAMTIMARSNPVSKSITSSRSGSGFRLSLFWSWNGAQFVQAASFLTL